jgi:hypothetical protein
MGAKPNRNNAKWYPVLGVAVGTIGLGWWLVVGLGLPRSALDPTRFSPRSTASPAASAAASSTPQPARQEPVPPEPARSEPSIARRVPDGAERASYQGGLRISNPTEYPVRVALLSKSSTSPKPNYEIPAHWDFAPQEGGDRGLIVSLPDRGVKLKQGDVLVAFAQDGSRRYWGPYVVGATAIPLWNPEAAEWQLTLEP